MAIRKCQSCGCTLTQYETAPWCADCTVAMAQLNRLPRTDEEEEGEGLPEV